MEKLIELFNEYERPQTNHIYTAYEVKENMNRLDILQEFIKWLVDNDKITSDGIKPRDKLVKEITIIDQDGNAIGWDNKYTEEEQLLMYLSIQDEPIEFLLSILK